MCRARSGAWAPKGTRPDGFVRTGREDMPGKTYRPESTPCIRPGDVISSTSPPTDGDG
jgi:hypothetical protein